jgi:hypothetical protein
MANDSGSRRRLNRMAKDRVEALRAQTRRQVALDVLDETGEVTTAAVDARMSQVWTEPSSQSLANALAAKTKAGVEFEGEELAKLRAAVERAERHTAKFRDRLADAERAEENARKAVTEAEARLDEARAMADLAAEQGDAGAADPAEDVRVEADTANANTEG